MRVQGNILFIFLGVVIGLLWNGRSKTAAVSSQNETSKQDRTPEEMSPTLKQLRQAKHSIYDVDEVILYEYLWKLSRELVQPDMTKAEADNTAREIAKLMQSLDSYKEVRQRKIEYAGEQWLDELSEER